MRQSVSENEFIISILTEIVVYNCLFHTVKEKQCIIS